MKKLLIVGGAITGAALLAKRWSSGGVDFGQMVERMPEDAPPKLSQVNIEIVRAAIEAAVRRPKPDWGTMNALFHPDHEFLPRDVGLEGGGGHRGAQGYREWLTNVSKTLEWEGTLAQVTEIDHERVLAVMPTKFRGRQSGAETEQRVGAVVTVQGEKVVRTELFQSPEEALEAAGLQE